ncbi:mitochondrial single stranded DNA specific 5'-3' exodeoxyribonuclease Exo5 [Schizosaccharomyces osmophilus]|uniref:Mitochondrial single stranded DNA specific 5'-3' exodeoxyribonuclease Exo5 n=1 Tax=Schizosaccharomyces osmophilus TaxID=2545709 RepID=A0AAF0AV33_9SCHI|nr:mitochondrial single stranded DNA specific 5'-3' exodeoxyribonuclease Exo5 [Schizosaccharomyces osmophilus]WBW72003.1 mitochondrial single stranded DNA specific 5'-3' exodeoxyribonuclease Exo5 [Schizosaccharomyces osmophilus]
MEDYEVFDVEDLNEFLEELDKQESSSNHNIISDLEIDGIDSEGKWGITSIEHDTIEEDMFRKITLYDLFRKRRGYLNVTDLVSPLWCEVQQDYYLTKKLKKTSPQMIKGSSVHQHLEYETTPPTGRILLNKYSKEEPWALKILKQIEGLHQLYMNGITREFPIWGFYKDSLVMGIIDEISLSQQGAITKEPRDIRDFWLPAAKDIYFTDNKTRFSNTRPSDSQIYQSKIQVMYYAHLFLHYFPSLNLKSTQPLYAKPNERDKKTLEIPWLNSFYKSLNLDGSKDLGTEFLEQSIRTIPIIPEDEFRNNNSLHGLYKISSKIARRLRLNISDKNLGIAYWNPRTQQLSYVEKFDYEPIALEDCYNRTNSFWRTMRDPVGVPPNEVFKCRSCEFRDECWWLQKKQTLPFHTNN